MAALTATMFSDAGIAVATTPAGAGGDTFANTGSELLYVSNTSGATRTVTFDALSFRGRPFQDNAPTVANGTPKVFGPFDPLIYGGTVSVSYDSVTNVAVTVWKMPTLSG